ncbi:MAG: ABC transporter permease [Terriglobia bacterium]|jgi:predicted permease
MRLRREFRKFGVLFRRRQPGDDLEEEIRSHLEMEERENLEAGMSPEEAHYAALRRFGNVTLTQERSREMWRWSTVETLWQDLGYGVRQLRRSPGFATVAILTLALGVGANTAIFSVINAVLLTPLPVKNPKELIQLVTVGPYGVGSFSYPALKRFRDENHECSEMAAIGWLSNLDAAVDGQPETVEGRIVSGNFFSFLGVSASAGRTFTGGDEKTRPTSAVAVISYAYWKRRFGLSPTVVGRSITLNRTIFTIVGVAPAGFSGIEIGYSPDIYVPMTMEPAFHDEMSWLNQPDYHWLRIMARLKPGVSRERAGAELAVIHRQLQAGMSTKGWSPAERNDLLSTRLEVNSAARGIIFGLPEQFSGTLYILMAMVGLVLLIACANVANLLLGRASVRQKEIAVRVAIGAGRFRLIRQLLTESMVLAVGAGALGLACAYWASAGIVALMSVGRDPLFLEMRPDPRVLGFTGAVALFATVLFGLAPALRGTRVNLAPALKEGAGGSGGRISRLGLGKGLVVLQVALSLLLLFGAGLFARTLENLRSLDPGFDRKGVLLFSLDPTKSGYKGPAVNALYKQMIEHLDSVPGVSSASVSMMTPITGGGGIDNSVAVEGYTPRPDENLTVFVNAVGPRYFETLHTPLLLGRDFSLRDTDATPKVAIINQTMARYFFGNGNPIGKKFGWFGDDKNKMQFEIVGVAEDSKYETLREKIPRTAYLDCFQRPLEGITFEVRTSVRPSSLISQIRGEIHAIDAGLRIGGFTTLEEHVEDSLGHERLMATLSSLFAALAVVLACVGLYGVMAYSVARRTSEIGIRMALGAGRAQIVGTILRESALLILAGVVLGLPIAIAVARVISSRLYGLKPADPLTIAGTILLLTAVTGLASYIPARRAMKVDPLVALRNE